MRHNSWFYRLPALAALLGALCSTITIPVQADRTASRASRCACGKAAGQCVSCQKGRAAAEKTGARTVAATRTITLKLSGLHCVGCEQSVAAELQKVRQVKSAQVSHASQTAVVRYDRVAPKTKELIAAVKRAGYRVIAVNKGR
ncbi:MAG: heavy-metal-associated domain-containing protein [Chloroherpetonaceae bacterium]|nr:cation transporter [Chthonomonadaceae bacterium]MDW8206201.1 heavy-metal-associated domain-containing protein [Chloroherpetonaceae bacterium]